MSEPKALSRQFDDAAQLYDEVRSRYPEEIVEQIIAFAALPALGRIFEVGCGTGQMTLPFAIRGIRWSPSIRANGWLLLPPSIASPIRESTWCRAPLKPGRTCPRATTWYS